MLKNAAIEGSQLPSKMIIDNDGIYGHWIEKVFKEFEIDVIRIPKGAPWCNGIVERFHFSLKRETLGRVILKDDSHVNTLCKRYQRYFNRWRAHQGINGEIPSKVHNLIPIENKLIF